MKLSQVPGQPRASRFLSKLIQDRRLPHAILLTGMAGIGKKNVALALAQSLLCSKPLGPDACDQCSSCRKISRNTHPDWMVVRKEGASIKIDQIRQLCQRTRSQPYEGRYRVVLVPEAQDLGTHAGNALLKLLEEPPAKNIFILCALEPQMLLPTIVSRCCHIRCQPLPEDLLARELVEHANVEPAKAAEAARHAFGSRERARGWLDPAKVRHRDALAARLFRVVRAPMLDFFLEIDQWLGESEDLEEDLECIKFWIREEILGRIGRCEASAHPKDPFGLRNLDLDARVDLFTVLEDTLDDLRNHANKRLTLEGFALLIKDILNGKGCRHSFPRRWQGVPL